MGPTERFLAELPLFATFPAAKLGKLVKQSEVRSYAPQSSIIRFGQPGTFLGVLLEGTAEASISGSTGVRRRIGLIHQGELLGEMSLLTGEPTNADVIAVENCRVLLIPQTAFAAYLAVNPNAVRLMAQTITARLRGRNEDEEALARLEDAWQQTPDPYGLNLSTAAPTKILVVNCGSSSLKFGYFDTAQEDRSRRGTVDTIGLATSRLVASSSQDKYVSVLGQVDHRQAFRAMIDHLTDPELGVITDVRELTAVGHRVVHGGETYASAVVVDDHVLKEIERCSVLAPLHNPLNLMAIRSSMELVPGVPQVAVFDTSFHQKMPPQAYLYALPYDLYENMGIRRYGFHGISHNYVSLRAAAYLRRDFRELKIISCHLGSGASICAIDHGRSVDTSMGVTPLEGLVMSTRSGDLDPSVVVYLCRDKGFSIEEVDDILNRQSGIKGISRISSDFQQVAEAANRGDRQALLAVHMFCYRLRKYIGAYVAVLGGLDALIFTGGIGEHSEWVRGLACQGLSYMGISVDDVLNKTGSPPPGQVVDISEEGSRARVLLIPTDEERMIARETIRALGQFDVALLMRSQEPRQIPVEVSAHHVHLSREAADALFGKGYELTKRADLSQPGQFACQETVNLIGPNGRVERARVLGPLRSQTQVEISMTEEFRLGISAPIRASGDLAGSPGVTIEGPRGSFQIPLGVVCAHRHIHMSPAEALQFAIRDRDVVEVRVDSPRALVFGDVLVRVDPSFRLSFHLDTDEANAAGITTGMVGHLVGVQERR